MTTDLVPPLVDTDLIRGQLERLAYWSMNGRVDDALLPNLLAELSPLPLPDALMWFDELIESIFALGLPWWEVIPDATGTARDLQADDYIRDRIEAALNALTGVAP